MNVGRDEGNDVNVGRDEGNDLNAGRDEGNDVQKKLYLPSKELFITYSGLR